MTYRCILRLGERRCGACDFANKCERQQQSADRGKTLTRCTWRSFRSYCDEGRRTRRFSSVCCSARQTHTTWAMNGSRNAQTQRAAKQACRCSRTSTILTRPHVTRSITLSAKRQVVWCDPCKSAGAATSRWHAVAMQPNMKRTGTHAEYSVEKNPRGSTGSSCKR